MAARTNIAIHCSANSNANSNANSKPRINWFILGSWSMMLIMCLAFWAGVIALFM